MYPVHVQLAEPGITVTAQHCNNTCQWHANFPSFAIEDHDYVSLYQGTIQFAYKQYKSQPATIKYQLQTFGGPTMELTSPLRVHAENIDTKTLIEYVFTNGAQVINILPPAIVQNTSASHIEIISCMYDETKVEIIVRQATICTESGKMQVVLENKTYKAIHIA